MIGRLRPFFCLEFADQFAHLLCARAWHHHHGIRGAHDDQIFDADHGSQALIGMD
jgi:hypothetical protein